MNRILYAQAVYGVEEKMAVLQSLDNTWLVGGKKVEEFEEKVAKLFGKMYGVATNSGSSANLLALTVLNLPKGSEVITPACTFATTVAPIIQCGLVPVFVDSVIGRYTIDENLIEDAITEKTKAIVVPQLIGGVSDMKKIRGIADKYNLQIIDDSCDTFAPTYNQEPIAKYSDMTTTSFYGSHIITTMGTGGMVMTDNFDTYNRLKSLINWGRVGTDREDFNERFNYDIDNIPYDSKFIYSNLGFNMKMTEAQAAFGLEQLKKLRLFEDIRFKNHVKLVKYFHDYEKWFYLPTTIYGSHTTWLAFALTVKDEAPFSRYDFIKHLDSNGIQIRVLFSGNITRHPAYKKVNYLVKSELKNADKIMESGFLIGCHQGMTSKDTDRLIEICEEFLSKK